MIRVVALVIALCGLIFVRGSSADFVPVWSPWWWAWILATCAIAGCVGWVAHDVAEHRRHR